jgi:hypothetical protein
MTDSSKRQDGIGGSRLFLFCENGKIRVRFFLTQGSEGLDMNHDYIKYRWPRLQENLNQSFNNYFQNASDTSECKIIRNVPLLR